MLLPDGCVTDKGIIPILFATASVVHIYLKFIFLVVNLLFLQSFGDPCLFLLSSITSRWHIYWSGIISSIGSVFQLKSYKHWEQIFHVSARLCSASHIWGWCQSLVFWLWLHNLYSSAAWALVDSLPPCTQNFFWTVSFELPILFLLSWTYLSVASSTWPFFKF